MEPIRDPRRRACDRRAFIRAAGAAITCLLAGFVLTACSGDNLPPTPVASATLTPIVAISPVPTANSAQATQHAEATGAPGGGTATSGATSTSTSASIPANPTSQVVNQSPSSVPPFVFFGAGKVADHWSDASYGNPAPVIDTQNTEVQRDGHPVAKITYGCDNCAFGISDFEGSNDADMRKYTQLRFWVNGGAAGGQRFGVILGNFSDAPALPIDKYLPGGRIPANSWQEVVIPVADLVANYAAVDVNLVRFFAPTGGAQPPFYLDDLELVKEETPPVTPTVVQVQVSVDTGSKRQPISPFIYGMAGATDDVMSDANLTLNRLGGNSATRYNWTLGDASNRGSDYQFANVSLSDDPAARKPSGFADLTVQHDKSLGIETLLTVPLIGYVARDDSLNTKSTGVPDQGGAPVSSGSEAIAGYDPKQNQQTTSVKSVARKGAPFQDPPDPNAPAVYQDEWINHLTKTFGKATDGGVGFYAMDNEPDLWADSTHVDVHPVRLGYDALLSLFKDYSGAVKAVDPTAKVTGPVLSGWTGYWYSALDRGDDNFATAADRKAHGGMPLVPWFLDQMHKADTASGQRTLDVLDIHYYPQAPGVSSNMADPTDAALRLRSTRALWDPSYTDESWIANTADPPNVELIPRMKSWIDQYYPGTKLGITEWRWYAEDTMNGALAVADVLGIYGREGVYLACYWNDYSPPPDGYRLTVGMPGVEAFKMFRNFDGNKGTFGDVSVAATTATDPDKLSVFASDDTKTNQVKIMLLNKTQDEEMATNISLAGGSFGGQAKVYRLSGSGSQIQQMPGVALSGASLSVDLPPSSITLLVIDKSH